MSHSFNICTKIAQKEITLTYAGPAPLIKNTTCQEINSNFDELKNKILAQDDGQTNVKFQYFDKNKNGEVKKRLKQVSTQLWMEEIISFIAERLSKTIHHRNQLKHYRSVIGEFRELYRVSQYKRDPFGG